MKIFLLYFLFLHLKLTYSENNIDDDLMLSINTFPDSKGVSFLIHDKSSKNIKKNNLKILSILGTYNNPARSCKEIEKNNGFSKLQHFYWIHTVDNETVQAICPQSFKNEFVKKELIDSFSNETTIAPTNNSQNNYETTPNPIIPEPIAISTMNPNEEKRPQVTTNHEIQTTPILITTTTPETSTTTTTPETSTITTTPEASTTTTTPEIVTTTTTETSTTTTTPETTTTTTTPETTTTTTTPETTSPKPITSPPESTTTTSTTNTRYNDNQPTIKNSFQVLEPLFQYMPTIKYPNPQTNTLEDFEKQKYNQQHFNHDLFGRERIYQNYYKPLPYNYEKSNLIKKKNKLKPEKGNNVKAKERKIPLYQMVKPIIKNRKKPVKKDTSNEKDS